MRTKFIFVAAILLVALSIYTANATEVLRRKHHALHRAKQATCNCPAAPITTRMGPLIDQNRVPNGALKCWLAVSAMMLNWKNSVRTNTIASMGTFFTNPDLRNLITTNQALPVNLGAAWQSALGVQDRQQSMTAQALCDLLRTKGPIVSGGLSEARGSAANVWGHVRIMVGMTGNCGGDGAGAQVVYADPDGGRIRNMPFTRFVANMETFHRRYNEAFAAQIAQLTAAGRTPPVAEQDKYRRPSSYLHFP